MPCSLRAAIEIFVIFRKQIYVVEDKASEVVNLECFQVRCVHDLSFIERKRVLGLFRYEDCVVEVLGLEEGVDVS